MLNKTVLALFERDLNKLKMEIEAYQQEENLWLTTENISNSAGNLCLHLIGNLNAFIGSQLGNTGYVRHRELEFSTKNIPKKELISSIKETLSILRSTLPNISEEALNADYPMVVFQEKMSTGYFLIHLTGHLAYHLGQINYHRRFLD
ncbi:MAG: DUF1572 family protein [Crocinitomicaceae bacterium]